jgi:DNA-binding NarL/FixJ family response regulator
MSVPVRVFVVEDSPLIRRRIIDDINAMERFDVVGFAESQDDAIESIMTLHPDVVVTDLRLKEGSGIEVVRQVRASRLATPPRIFVLTNYASPEYKQECMVSGADDFFDKSCNYARFLSSMQQVTIQ